MGQVALVKAELVVVVIVLIHLAVVVHGADGDGDLIDGGGADLGQGNGHGVVAGLDDTGDVGGGLTGLHADGVVGEGVTDLGLDQSGDAGAGGLGVDALVGDVIAVLSHDGVPEVGSGSVGSQTVEAPSASGGSDIVGVSSVAGGHTVIHDLLSELLASGVEGSPEGVVLILGEVVVGGVTVRTGSQNQVHAGIHTGTVGLQTLDGDGVQSGHTVIGGVQQDVVREDNVVDGHLGTVGELHALFHGDVVVHGAVGVLDDITVGNAGVCIVGAVVGTNVALDALQHHGAFTVGAQQGVENHAHDLVFIIVGVEEGRELTVEVLRTDHKSLGGRILLTIVVAVTAGGEQADTHEQRQDQRECFFHKSYSFLIFATTGICPQSTHNAPAREARRKWGYPHL